MARGGGVSESMQTLTDFAGLYSQWLRQKEGAQAEELATKVKLLLPRVVKEHLRIENGVHELKIIVMLLSALAVEMPQAFSFNGKTVVGSLFFKLLPLLCDECFAPISSALFTALNALMGLMQGEDMPTYRTFFRDSVLLLQDLQAILMYHLEEDSQLTKQTPSGSLVIRCYKEAAERVNADTLESTGQGDISQCWGPSGAVKHVIDVSKVSSGIVSQVNVTRLLSGLILQGGAFLADECDDLWKTLCAQVMYGPADLKVASMEALRQLLASVPVPPFVHTHVLEHVVALLHCTEAEIRSQPCDDAIASLLEALTGLMDLGTCPSATDLAEVIPRNVLATKSEQLQLCEIHCSLAQRIPSVFAFSIDLLKMENLRRFGIRALCAVLAGMEGEGESKPKRRKISQDELYEFKRESALVSSLEQLTTQLDADLFAQVRLLGAAVEIHLHQPDRFPAKRAKAEFCRLVSQILELSAGKLLLETVLDVSIGIAQLAHHLSRDDSALSGLLKVLSLFAHRSSWSATDQATTAMLLSLDLSCWVAPSDEQIQFFVGCLADERPAVARQALLVLPHFLSQVQSTSDTAAVLARASRRIGEADEKDRTISEICGLACCVSAGDCRLVLPSSTTVEDLPIDTKSHVIQCPHCDDGASRAVSSIPFAKWQAFFGLLGPANSGAVRAQFLKSSFRRILAHTRTNELKSKKTFLTDFIGLTVAADPDVREGMVFAITAFFSNAHCVFNEHDIYGKILNALYSGKGNIPLQKSLLATFGEAGKVTKGHFLTVILLTLVEYFAHEEEALRLVAFDSIQGIADSQGLTIPQLIATPVTRKEEISCFLVNKMASSTTIREVVSVLFAAKSLKDWVRSNIDVTLPPLLLLPGGDQTSSSARASAMKPSAVMPVIELLARLLGVSVKQMIVDKLPCIFAHLTTCAADGQLHPSLQQVLTLGQFKVLASRVKETPSLYIFELFLRLREWPMKATRALECSQQYYEAGRVLSTQEQRSSSKLEDFLQEHFLEVIHRINVQYSKEESLERCVHMVESFPKLVELLGKHATSFRPKILATLKLFGKPSRATVAHGQELLTREEGQAQLAALKLAACRAWEMFFKVLDLAALGPMLTQLVAELVPFYSDEESLSVVRNIFKYLMQHEKALRTYIQKVPESCFPVDDCPEVQRVRAILVGSMDDQLKQLIHGVGHESVNARQRSLEQLHSFLVEHRGFILSKVTPFTSEKVVSKLMKRLLRCSAEASDDETLHLLAKCIGEIGALAPACVNVHLRPQIPSQESPHALARDIIMHFLVKDLIATSSTLSEQNWVGLAIQELLDFCGCRAFLNKAEHSKNKALMADKGADTWEAFSPEIQELIYPFIFSLYELKYTSDSSGKSGSKPPAIFKRLSSEPDFSYDRWITEWCGELVNRAPGGRKAVYRACSGPLKHNVALARFLLPYVIWDLLQEDSPELMEGIVQEFVSVLRLSHASGTPKRAAGNKVAASPSKAVGESSAVSQQCAQAVFGTIDVLTTWMERHEPTRSSRSSRSQHRYVARLLEKIPQKLLAEASYRCKAFTRSLWHFENHMRQSTKKLSKTDVFHQTLDDLERIYKGLEDADGLLGVSSIRAKIGVRNYVKEANNAGQWATSFACMEQALQGTEPEFRDRVGQLMCLKELGHLNTMLSLVQASLGNALLQASERSKAPSVLAAYGVQAAWRLQEWDAVDRLTSVHKRSHFDFEVSLGKMLLHLTRLEKGKFLEELRQTRKEVMTSLAAASMESYHRAYPFLLRLHICRDIEQSYPILADMGSELVDLNIDWIERLDTVTASYQARELIVRVHHVLFSSFRQPDLSMTSYLDLAKQARNAGQTQVAESTLHLLFNMEKRDGDSPVSLTDIQTELAKLRWQRGEQYEAIQELKSIIQRNATDHPDQASAVGKQLLLQGQWMEKTGQQPSGSLIDHYERVVRERPNWEKGYVALGQYLDTVLQQIQANRMTNGSVSLRAAYEVPTASDPQRFIDYLHRVVENYGKALLHGHKYIYQTLPRMLTVWFEEGDLIVGEPSMKGAFAAELVKVNKLMEGFKATLPVYQWLTCFPQLVSRIGCPTENIYIILERIIYRVLDEYPEQAFWGLTAATKSSLTIRQVRAAQILSKAKSKPAVKKNLSAAENVCELFLAICNYKVTKSKKTMTLNSTRFKDYVKVKGRVLLPTQSALTVTLPGPGESSKGHMPFPQNPPYIKGYKSEIQIMTSLQMPKKIVVKGDDGLEYSFLLKPTDDLRKDARLQEFNMVVNMLLEKNQDCRRRKLAIRTYGVVPLNETCGIIEWVNNTTSYRTATTNQMLKSKVEYPDGPMKVQEIKSLLDDPKKKSLEKFRMFKKRNPPVLYKWFAENFPDPSTWYGARLLFTQSVAVMSMVGHIVGLGDRHGENILMENHTGGVVHIDLNCLFWKGLSFECPETVPFRLTPFMVDAFGVSGCDGAFRRACELTLALLRNNRDTLLCVLEPLVFDPLVEATPKGKKGTGAADWTRGKLSSIRSLLEGQVGGVSPISVAGHVQKLLDDSMNERNLSKMYVGWTPWI